MRAVTSLSESRGPTWPAFVLVIAAALFILIPLTVYFRDPVYHWEIGSSSFILGGFTALGLFALVALTVLLRIRKSYKITVTSLLVLLYLRLYDVDLPFLFMLLWLEAMVAGGTLLIPRQLRLSGPALFCIKFASGIAIWTAMALVLSAFHLARPPLLLACTMLLLIVGLWRSGWRPLLPSLTRYLTHPDWVIAVVSGYLLVSIVVLFARAPQSLDFDSLWYGLRSQWILAPHGSIFDRLYLPFFVYYYPKLFELLNLPTDYFQDYTYTIALNIALYLAYAAGIVAVMRSIGVRQRHAFLLAACIVSLPAVSMMSLTAKPDNLANYLMLTATLCFALGLRHNSLWLLGTMAMLLLALSTKLTAVPFGGLLGLVTVIALGHKLMRSPQPALTDKKSLRRFMFGLLALSVAVSAVFMYRTYYLTGMPLFGDPTILKIFEHTGFHLDYPAEIPDLHKAHIHLRRPLHLLLGYLFVPTTLTNVSFVWPGNMGALLMLCGIPFLFRRNMHRTTRIIVAGLLPVIAAGMVFALSYGQVNGTAGYYYTFPVTLASIAGYTLLWRSGSTMQRVLPGILVAALVGNALLGFIVSFGEENPGAPLPPLSLLSSPADGAIQRRAQIQAEGLAPIEDYIQKNFTHDCRAIAVGDWSATLSLSCTIDNIGPFAGILTIMENEVNFTDYLNRADINLVIAPRFPANTVFFRTAERLRALGLPVIESPAYFAVDLRGLAGHLPKPLVNETAPAVTGGIDLMTLLPQAKAADLASPGSPRGRLYRQAPPWVEYIAEAPGVMLYADTTLTFPLPASATGRSGMFSTTLGILPEDTMLGAGPFEFRVRLLAGDGRELASQSWRIAAGDNQRVQMPITMLSGAGPLYLEFSCRSVGKNRDATVSLLAAQPRVTWR